MGLASRMVRSPYASIDLAKEAGSIGLDQKLDYGKAERSNANGNIAESTISMKCSVRPGDLLW